MQKMWPFAKRRKNSKMIGTKKNFEKGTEGVAEAKPLVKSFVGKDRKR